jgi:hypothetical protein
MKNEQNNSAVLAKQLRKTKAELAECKRHLNAIWMLARTFIPVCPAKSRKMWEIALREGNKLAQVGKRQCQAQILIEAANGMEDAAADTLERLQISKDIPENTYEIGLQDAVRSLRTLAKEIEKDHVKTGIFCRAHEFSNDWKEVTLSQLVDMLENPKRRIGIASVCNHEKTFVDHGVKYCERCNESLEVTSYRD